MIQQLQILDQKFFLYLNQLYNTSWLDWLMLSVTDMQRNTPMVILALVVLFTALIRKYRSHFWKPALILIMAVGLTDLICYRIIKAHSSRTRPFQTEAIKDQVRKIGHAHGSSFPSNHSGNSFAGATMLSYLFPNFSIFFIIYAALVALSRVYVGVHYPFDVIFGGLVGVGVSMLIHRVFKNQIKISTLKSD